ncbi:MAG: hypothetical protein ABIJ24_01255 [Nitrospinota bacterium]|nr:hypothetical protein [Nitrospinota bacterium]
MSGQQIDPVDNLDDEEKGREDERRIAQRRQGNDIESLQQEENRRGGGDRRKEERRIAQRRQGNDVEYLKHEGNRRRADRRRGDGEETIDHTLTDMLNKGPDMDKVIKIVFTRVLFVIAMAIILYHIAAYFIFPRNLFRGDFNDLKKVEDVKK